MLGLFTSWVFGNKDVKNAVFNKLGLSAIFASVVGFITWITGLVIGAMDKVTSWVVDLANATWPEIDFSAVSDVGAIVNTLFPLNESIAIFGSLYLFWAIVLLIRWVKSFVPTVAN